MTTKSEFVITEHHAKRAGLHWDLRFQMPKSKMWASFAVRKGVPKDVGKKVLAVRTHDHKRDEALLTGKIESGYGAGTFKEWDRGSCIIHKYSDAHIAIEFKGRKIKGVYHLINVTVKDRKIEGKQYWLFKGKTIKEMMGMAGKVPTSGIMCDTEEGTSEETCKKLPWSISEGISNTKNYAMIATYTALKGFFKTKDAGEFLLLAIYDSKEKMFVLVQFFQKINDGTYLSGIVAASHSPSSEVTDNYFDNLRYNSQVKILEDKIQIKKIERSVNNINITFNTPSKYLGKNVDLFADNRLPQGYFLTKCIIKNGFEPVQSKVGSNIMDLGDVKKIRAFTSSRMKKILDQKLRL